MVSTSFCFCSSINRKTRLICPTDEILACDCGEHPNHHCEWKWDPKSINDTVFITGDQKVFLRRDSKPKAFVKGDTPMVDGFEYFWEIKVLSKIEDFFTVSF